MKNMRIPSEIFDFFGVEEGQTLLVKGMPGTGKTTLALEIMNSVCNKMNGMYISTRVNPFESTACSLGSTRLSHPIT